MTTDEAREVLHEIEADLDQRRYRPGPWSAVLRTVDQLPQEQRVRLADDISRVSDKLHRRHGHATYGLRAAILLELGATVMGCALLVIGLRVESNLPVLVSAAILSATLQPLLKVATGRLLGVEYAYAYLWGIEPRFKMRYGSYIAAARWRRVVLHLSGAVGTPFALWLVGSLAAARLPTAAAICIGLFWVLVAVQVVPFVAGVSGLQRLGPLSLRLVGSGVAGAEVRRAVGGRRRAS